MCFAPGCSAIAQCPPIILLSPQKPLTPNPKNASSHARVCVVQVSLDTREGGGLFSITMALWIVPLPLSTVKASMMYNKRDSSLSNSTSAAAVPVHSSLQRSLLFTISPSGLDSTSTFSFNCIVKLQVQEIVSPCWFSFTVVR